jgi:hypothetical protein
VLAILTGRGTVRTATARTLLLLALCLVFSQPACFWKLWSKKPPLAERTQDVYGTVESVDAHRLIVKTRKGDQEFTMVDSSIKGSEFQSGAYVHVYYKVKDGVRQVTMVVEKVDK